MGAKIIKALVQLEIIALMVFMDVAMYDLGWAIAWYRILLRFGSIPPPSSALPTREEFPFGVKKPKLSVKMTQWTIKVILSREMTPSISLNLLGIWTLFSTNLRI